MSGEGVTIRRGGGSDAAGILACLAAAFEPYRNAYTPEAFLDTVLNLEMLQERFSRMSIFVAEDSSGQIVGTVACSAMTGGEGHLRGMAVLPTWHGSGVAARLLERAESELRQRKCNGITLDTTSPLVPAMRFYEKNGFRRSGKVSDFFGMPLFEYCKNLESPVGR